MTPNENKKSLHWFPRRPKANCSGRSSPEEAASQKATGHRSGAAVSQVGWGCQCFCSFVLTQRATSRNVVQPVFHQGRSQVRASSIFFSRTVPHTLGPPLVAFPMKTKAKLVFHLSALSLSLCLVFTISGVDRVWSRARSQKMTVVTAVMLA